MKYLRRFEKIIHQLSRFFSWVAAGSLLIMAILTALDVVGRYLFNSPITGTQDLIELGLVICVFGAMGHVTMVRGHIRADMLNPVLSKRGNAILSAGSFIISLLFAVILTWQTTIKAVDSLKNMDMVTSTISIPIAPFLAFTSIGLTMMILEMIFDIFLYIKEARDLDNPLFSGEETD